jgi:hypothetical protein
MFSSLLHVSQKVESVTGELVAAEEEVARWKEAATAEAAAGKRIFNEVEALHEEVEINFVTWSSVISQVDVCHTVGLVCLQSLWD